MEQRLYEALQRNPIIAAVRDDEGLAQCLRTDIQTVFVLYGDICNISEIVRQIKDAGKIAIVHADLISGLAAKEISVDFLRRSTQADGVISTRANMIQRAKELNMIAILRVFLIDSMALDSALSAKNLKPDAIDILPGLMPSMLRKVRQLTGLPFPVRPPPYGRCEEEPHMCTDTKGRIAEAVEQMLQTRPVCKITVQRVMEQAQMKRQSFYYHYQDIYSVLEWIVETQLCAPLQYDGAQAPGEWCLQALTLLREKQPLLRKISHALGQETMYRLTGKVIRPQLARLLPDPAAVDGATQSLALDMLCQAAFCTVDSLVARRTPLDAEAFMHQLQALFLTVQQI